MLDPECSRGRGGGGVAGSGVNSPCLCNAHVLVTTK